MPDFYADHPFAEVVLKIPAPEKLCSVGDIVTGLNTGALGRVERFVEGGLRIHPISDLDFSVGELLVSPTGTAYVGEIAKC